MDNANDNDLIRAIAPSCEKYPDVFMAGALGCVLGKICSWSNNAEIKKLASDISKLQQDVRVNEERLATLMQQHTEQHHAHMEMLSLTKREMLNHYMQQQQPPQPQQP